MNTNPLRHIIKIINIIHMTIHFIILFSEMKLKFNYIMLKFFLKKLKKFIIILLSMTFYMKQKIMHNNNPFEAEYKEELLTQIYNDIVKFLNLVYRRLLEERTVFHANIKIIYENEFRRILN